MSIITLTTDFGYQDSYVAEMKGAILGINPAATIIDVSHAISSHDIHEAAFTIFRAYRHFPKGTAHVVVVDPGVGSNRRVLLVKTAQYYFIAPDNGVLTYVLHAEQDVIIRDITNSAYFQESVSATFEGRDKMAPVAAHLTKTDISADIGNIVDNPVQSIFDGPVVMADHIVGHVLHCDHFGNIITDITPGLLEGCQVTSIQVGKYTLPEIVRSYSDVENGDLLAVWGSSGFLEIAANCESAQRIVKTKVRDNISVTFARSTDL